ncbi:acetyl-CoA carboxylase, biotin carboxyl carrier protein [Brevundimonas sp. LM2]|uniref:acetyl-CoA carboxylase biotin carboxyl carrier protein n=1 Tax=Brevundimonas sp. LM2 TaxID=1938605 RepID=UPI0009839BF9|nr:acetyl-CoA carboxylase biotin carboxyl carrier protein [Brevundimonas sp. LM2]AQR61751.1 acetyl-CoA carboxylase, biotin carboxyl carrier protein [Brevundimonas sp. LM2]
MASEKSLKNEPSVEIDPSLVRQLADILNDTSLTEIEVERGELRIRVAREISAAPVMSYAPAVAHAAPAPAPAATPLTMPSDPATIVAKAGEQVKSPMVGTVYLQASPEAAPFVQAGDKVKKGQTLLIIEAMKTMNPIQAPRDGVVSDILVGDAQPVEFGEALVLLES